MIDHHHEQQDSPQNIEFNESFHRYEQLPPLSVPNFFSPFFAALLVYLWSRKSMTS
jgi:hypothetical protein